MLGNTAQGASQSSAYSFSWLRIMLIESWFIIMFFASVPTCFVSFGQKIFGCFQTLLRFPFLPFPTLILHRIRYWHGAEESGGDRKVNPFVELLGAWNSSVSESFSGGEPMYPPVSSNMAGKFTIEIGDFSIETPFSSGIFHCHVWSPEGKGKFTAWDPRLRMKSRP